MTAAGDVLEIALSFGRACERAGVEYALGGSVATSLHGEPRTTQDIDIAVVLTEAQLPKFLIELGDDFAADEDELREAIRAGRSVNIFYVPSFMKVAVNQAYSPDLL